jgi:hypothetical protein
MRLIICLLVLLSFQNATSQIPTWSEDIAPIIYENCSHCHHEGTVAPFSLMSYEDFAENALTAYFNMEDGHMPPWPADPDYNHFVGETIVTDEQIADVLTWIENSMPYGDPELEPDPPSFGEGGSVLDDIDFVVAIDPFTLQTNGEETRWFVIPTDFEETVYVNAIEVIPGLSDYVHHCDISFDVTGQSWVNDQADPLPGFDSNTGWPNYTYYMNAWQPGAGPARYPDNWGIAVPPGADFVIEIHYGPGGAEEIDETYINLDFVDDPVGVRPVYASWLLGQSAPVLTDGPLFIPANTVQTFHQVSNPLSNPLSLISICPHMHLIGDTYKVWFETQEGDSIPLIDVEWNFHWQFYYMFQQVQVVPQGARLMSEVVYDNTVNNEFNPNNPPINVWGGGATTDEMILCFFIYANYQPGDEDIILDPELSTSELEKEPFEWGVYPNPTKGQLTLHSDQFVTDPGIVRILDATGRIVHTEDLSLSGRTYRLDISHLPAGNYSVDWMKDGVPSIRQVVKY